MMGRQVDTIGHSEIKSALIFGSNLNPGIYVVQVHRSYITKSYKIIKR
jgi:hypothetical protein